MKQIDIPLLKAEDIECRVQQCKKSPKGTVGAVLLLYKDARVDMRILDQLFGVFGWQRGHELINGNLFCFIDIWDEDNKQWVRKEDVGTESNTEKEKGQASDSFKRAGTNVGIGRELYTSPFIYITLEPGEYSEYQGKYKCNARFEVSAVDYNDRREISHLIIRDGKGKQRFTFNGNFTPTEPTPKPKLPPIPTGQPFVCEDCHQPITDYKTSSGKVLTAQELVSRSQKKYGRTLCIACAQKLKLKENE